jgi:RimJ/RimL family protein N-acetyltransferase
VDTGRSLTALTARARELWEFLAAGWPATRAEGETGTPAGREARFAPAVRVAVSPGSALCPPGWAGVVVIGDAALATAPDPGTARLIQQGLAGLPAASLADAYLLRNRLPVAAILGPASLAYLDPAEFRPWPGAVIAAPLSLDDPDFRRFVQATDPGEVEESGIEEITTPAFAIRERGQVVTAAGYRDWPRGTAHLSVLTAAAARDRGLARAAASAAVAHAIAEGRLPQWRARPLASRRVASAIGFRELGSQVSIRLAAPAVGPAG